ncbi:histidine kinase [Bacteroidota bacterium]
MKKTLLLIITISILSIHSSLSQKYYSRNYTINNGLPDNCIHDIYKDSRGFLWLGTDAGLSRFDGNEFKIYTSQDGLIGDKIWSVTEGDEGQLWIGCHNGGISKLNGTQITSYNVDSGLISNEVRKIYYSVKHKILLIGTENGLSVLKNDKFISFHEKLRNVNQRLQITDFIENDNFIYVFTNGDGLYKFIPELESLIRIPSDHPLNNQLTNSAYISTRNDTLINFNRKSFLSISSNNKFTQDFVGQILDYKEDHDKNIWIAAWNNNYINAGGIYKYDSLGLTNFGDKIGIKSRNILSLEFDSKENLLWIGTKDNGLYLYPLTNFSYYNAKDFDLQELNIVDLKICKSNNLWIATRNNIVKLSNSGSYKTFPFKAFNDKFKHFAQNKIKAKYQYLIDKNGSFQKYAQLIMTGIYPFDNPYQEPNGGIIPERSLYKPLKYDVLINKKLDEFNSILTDSTGNIWVGSNVGVFRIDKDTEVIKYYDLEGCQFNKFFIDSENKTYGINWADLCIYPNIVNSSRHYLYNYYEHNSPINISKIKNQENEIWFASKDYGLFVYDYKKFFSSKNQEDIDNLSFNDICFDNQGNIVTGNNNGIIYILNFSNDTIQLKYKIDNNNGLAGTSVRYLNCTNDNMLIAGTNSGLNLIDLNKLYNTGDLVIQSVNNSRGFTDYSGTCSVLQADNYIWIGSNDNLIQVDLKNIRKENNTYIDFYLKSISVNNEKSDLTEVKDKDQWTNIPKSTLKFPYYKNSLTFEYDAITYLDPENINFKYKLEGFHQNWVNETKDRRVDFQNLKPGKYRLRIKIVNTFKNLSSQELSVSFIISSPLWAKWWFIGLGVIIVLLAIWSIIRVRTRNIRKKERIRTKISERITEFEMKALRAQMNPHFIFNAINSIQNYMLDNDIDAALNHLSDFAKLIRLTLDNVSKKQVALDDELSYLEYYLKLEQMRFDKKFDTEIILPSEFESRKIIIPSMILQPYVENSIKHGFVFKDDGGKIKLEFQITDDNILKCVIEDNGIGRKKSRELNKSKKGHQSKGTFITNERLLLLNQTKQHKGYKAETIDLFDEYDLPCGTRVEIYIPQ